METATDTTYNCPTSSLLAHYRIESQLQQVGTLQRNKAGFFSFPQRRTLVYLINVNANKQPQISWRSAPVKPTAAIQKSKKEKLRQILIWLVLSAAAFATLCQCIPQGSTTAAQRAGRRHHTGTLTCLFLPPFSPPSPHFHTASLVGSHGPCHVCTGQMDDLQIESNQKMLLIYSSSFCHHSSKHIS